MVGTSTAFRVHLYTGQTLSASLVGAYPPDDLAVVKVAGPKDLQPASIADSSALAVGDIVFAIGNPLGLASSVTEGIVSATDGEAPEGNGWCCPPPSGPPGGPRERSGAPASAPRR
ncbi:MAG: S1C family serine protease [Acidimicrobiales bacterium]